MSRITQKIKRKFSQILDGMLEYGHGGQGSVKFRQGILKIRGKGDILKRIQAGYAQLRGRDVAKGVDFINPFNRGLHRGIGRCYVVLNRRAQRTGCTLKDRVYLAKTLKGRRQIEDWSDAPLALHQ